MFMDASAVGDAGLIGTGWRLSNRAGRLPRVALAPAPGQHAAQPYHDGPARPALGVHRRRAAALQLAPADLAAAYRGADRLDHHVVHQLAVAEALHRQPD